MSRKIAIQYGVIFGYGDASDWVDWEITVSGEAEQAYLKAKKFHLSLDEFDELNDALEDATKEIEEQEIENALEAEDEFVLECQGLTRVDPGDINDLIASRDAYAIEYFELEGLTEEELDEWDAYDLDDDKLPIVRDFDKSFKPYSPFDEGWTLNLEFAEHPEEEEIEKDEACATISELIESSDGTYEELTDYVDNCSDLCYDFDLKELAIEIGKGAGIDLEGIL